MTPSNFLTAMIFFSMAMINYRIVIILEASFVATSRRFVAGAVPG
jgi:hypothetical protein